MKAPHRRELSESPQATDPRVATLARGMAENGSARDGPVRSVLGIVGDRWSSLILLVLATGDWRHAELRRVLGGLAAEGAISQRVLTLKLRHLEREGFVAREVSPHVPPQVTYRLTLSGAGLQAQVQALIDWTVAEREGIVAARLAFDAADDN